MSAALTVAATCGGGDPCGPAGGGPESRACIDQARHDMT